MADNLLFVKLYGRSGVRLSCCEESSSETESPSSRGSDEEGTDGSESGYRCAIAITPSGVCLLLLWCPPLVSPYPFLLPPSPLDPPTTIADDVHHLHRRDPALPAARLQGRTARRQVRRPSPSGRRRGSGVFVRAEVCGDNAQVLGAVCPLLLHLLLLRQVRHRRRHQEEKHLFCTGMLTTRINSELLSAPAGITTTRPPRRPKASGTARASPCEKGGIVNYLVLAARQRELQLQQP
ncbi:uncharacterized protein LOC123396420 [Hordeum vulgare subsp. vulgare]|uniref:uncharacterized protein LOC123396420 n=1 Tax=Hordeum vulgare subsp. vulgare TaxID=112509 RepID=UPI001D1A4F18|nr:uncharacterized protein LOC123396420 [Hordeum vulgare subsp. vulgare]